MANSKLSDNEIDAYAAQRFSKEKLNHQGFLKKRANPQCMSLGEQSPAHMTTLFFLKDVLVISAQQEAAGFVAVVEMKTYYVIAKGGVIMSVQW